MEQDTMRSRNVLQAFTSLYRFLDENSEHSDGHLDYILSRLRNSSAKNLINSFQDILSSKKKDQQIQNVSQSFCHKYFTLPQVQIKPNIEQPNSFAYPSIQPNSSLSIINNSTDNSNANANHESQHFIVTDEFLEKCYETHFLQAILMELVVFVITFF